MFCMRFAISRLHIIDKLKKNWKKKMPFWYKNFRLRKLIMYLDFIETWDAQFSRRFLPLSFLDLTCFLPANGKTKVNFENWVTKLRGIVSRMLQNFDRSYACSHSLFFSLSKADITKTIFSIAKDFPIIFITISTLGDWGDFQENNLLSNNYFSRIK